MKDQPNLLLYLYHSATGKYLKFKHRVDKAVQSGRFEKFSRKKKSGLLHRLRKLQERIKKLYWQLKLAAAGTAAILGLSLINPANAQDTNLGPFEEQPRHLNPLRGPVTTFNYPSIATVDIDNDGDYDLVQGEYSGATNGANFTLLKNEGTNTNPVFVEDDVFFDDLVINSNDVYPAFADIDEDGDMDLFAGQRERFSYGESNGQIQYFRNDNGVFSEQTGPWNPAVTPKTGNPFNAITFGADSNVSPFFVDFDNDEDIDVVIGLDFNVDLYINDGDGNFSSAPISLDGSLFDDLITPALADMDDDGDVDLVLGSQTKYGLSNPLKYYRQTSPGNFETQSGIWDPEAKTGNPFDDISPGGSVSVAFINLDEDPETDPNADLDLVVVSVDQELILYYENIGESVFEQRNDTDNPFEGVNARSYALPVLVDIDGDTDLDAVIGNKYDGGSGTDNSRLRYYRNDEGTYNLITGEEDPFDGITLDSYSYFTPEFADIDADGDLDLITGNYNGSIRLYRRNEQGEYIQDTETNPFADINVGNLPVPRLVNLDNDANNTLELIIAERTGNIHYFKKVIINENTPEQDTVYQEHLSTENPFNDIDLVFEGTYKLIDIDHDGDYDFIGFATNTYNAEDDIVGFYENTGTRENPEFTLVNYDLLGGASINQTFTISTIIDYDNDGDLDLFLGENDGTVKYFLNNNPPPELTNNTEVFDLQLIPGSDPTVICNDFGIDDPDDDGYLEAIVKILEYEQGNDFLSTLVDHSESFASVGFNPTTGEYHFVAALGFTTTSDFENALSDITYHYEDTEGQFERKRNSARSITKTVRFEVFDTDKTNPVPVDFVASYANQVPQIGSTASDVTYTTPASSVVINNTITITDVDDLNMASATISITNFQPGQDNLLFTNQNGITGIFSTGAGVLTLTGSATKADYETALRSVRYSNMSSIPNTTPRTISFVVNDGEGNSAPEELDIDFNFPPSIMASSPTVSYGGSPVFVDNAITVTDVGDAINSASIYFSAGYQNGQDTLIVTPSGGITSFFNQGVGAMVLNGPANRADFETALRSITYNNISSTPTTGPRTIEIFIVDDNGQASNAVYITVNYSSQAPPVLASPSSAATYASGQLIVNNGITVSDADDTNIASATISIQSGFANTEDVLSFTPSGGITGTYTSSTGVLSLTGSAALANYETVLRSVTYENTNTGDRSKAPRSIVFQVNDGSALSNTLGTTVSLPNQVPVTVNTSTPPAYVSGSIVITDQITLVDSDNATFQAATVQITTGFQSGEDELIFTDQNNITGSYNPTTGLLSLGGSSSKANYQAALRSVQYRNNNTGDRNKTTRVFSFSVHDGATISNTVNASVTLPNQVPAISNTSTPPLYGSGSVAVATQLTLTDIDNATLQSATVIITSGLASAEDRLLFSDQNGITGAYTASSGTLLLSGSATKANYETALRSVLYQNSSANPNEAPRVISFAVNDGTSNSTAITVTLNINRPPVITPTPEATEAGSNLTIDIASIVRDPDNNIVLGTVTISSPPESGAVATIVNGNLVVDYSNVPDFTGTDHLTITICDALNRCTTEEITIEIGGDLVVFNAVSANGDGSNDFLFLRYIQPQNKVSIYNRWGDRVFEIDGYDNNNRDKRFEGLNDNGNELPSGTYFYKIEFVDNAGVLRTETGYVSLKK